MRTTTNELEPTIQNMKYTIIIASLIASAGMVNAATLFTSNFDGNDATTNSSTATGISWTTDAGVTMLDADLTAVGDTFAVLGNVSTTNNITMATNLNSSRATARGYSFDVSMTEAFDLSDLTISSKHLNNTGAPQSFVSDLNYSIVGINTTVANISGSVDGINTYSNAGGSPYISSVIDLSAESLVAGDYRVTVTINDMVGGGAFASYDGVTLEGTVVPEPSSTALLGLGGLALILRRRK